MTAAGTTALHYGQTAGQTGQFCPEVWMRVWRRFLKLDFQRCHRVQHSCSVSRTIVSLGLSQCGHTPSIPIHSPSCLNRRLRGVPAGAILHITSRLRVGLSRVRLLPPRRPLLLPLFHGRWRKRRRTGSILRGVSAQFSSIFAF